MSEVFENLRYVHEIGSREAADHALVFHASIGDRHIEGSDFIHVDEHRIKIAASRDLVWTALHRYADSSLRVAEPLGRLLRTEPLTGFEVTRDIPNQHLSMAGRHRFARYLLGFDLCRSELAKFGTDRLRTT